MTCVLSTGGVSEVLSIMDNRFMSAECHPRVFRVPAFGSLVSRWLFSEMSDDVAIASDSRAALNHGLVFHYILFQFTQLAIDRGGIVVYE